MRLVYVFCFQTYLIGQNPIFLTITFQSLPITFLKSKLLQDLVDVNMFLNLYYIAAFNIHNANIIQIRP